MKHHFLCLWYNHYLFLGLIFFKIFPISGMESIELELENLRRYLAQAERVCQDHERLVRRCKDLSEDDYRRHIRSGLGIEDLDLLTVYVICGDRYDFEDIERLLANVNNGGKNGWTFLHWACFAGNTSMIGKLLRCGANINAQDIFGYTPSHWAFQKGNEEVVRWLANAGADQAILSEDGMSPAQVATAAGYGNMTNLLTPQCCLLTSTLAMSTVILTALTWIIYVDKIFGV